MQWSLSIVDTLGTWKTSLVIIEVSSIQRLDNAVEPLYCGHFGTLELHTILCRSSCTVDLITMEICLFAAFCGPSGGRTCSAAV